MSPWVSQARSDPAVSPNYCMSLTCHTFLSLIWWCQHVQYDIKVCMCVCVRERERRKKKKKRGPQLLSSAFFRWSCGHLTAGRGRRARTKFPRCLSLQTQRPVLSAERSVGSRSFFVHLQLFKSVIFCVSLSVGSFQIRCFLQASYFHVFDLTCRNGLK